MLMFVEQSKRRQLETVLFVCNERFIVTDRLPVEELRSTEFSKHWLD